MAKAKAEAASSTPAKRRKVDKGKGKAVVISDDEDEFDKLLDDADGFEEALAAAARHPRASGSLYEAGPLS